MPRVFKPEAAGHIKATIQFHITGDKGGNWHLRIEDGRCTCREGTAEKADLIISTPADVWLRIARGELSGQAAYMSGSYKVKGDMNLLFRMQSMF
jgi:putative sterol carrier protein